VSRVVFGSEQDPLCKRFLAVMDAHYIGPRAGKPDARKIEVCSVGYLSFGPIENIFMFSVTLACARRPGLRYPEVLAVLLLAVLPAGYLSFGPIEIILCLL
jgi:hypothetical protein